MTRWIPILFLTLALNLTALAQEQSAAAASSPRESALATAHQIDSLVDATLAEQGIAPNPPTSDELFARRVFLDIIGRIPTYRELTDFLSSTDPRKRYDLIDSLLESEGAVSHNYNYWADVLRIQTRLVNQVNGKPYVDWVKRSIRENVPYDQFVYELLTAEGRVKDNGAAGYFIRDSGMPLDNMANTLRIFLGTRIGCAQCHDHPYDKWSQYEFYEMAAFTFGTQTRQRQQRGVNPKAMAADAQLSDREKQILRRLYVSQSYNVRDTRQAIKLPDDYKYSDAKPGERVPPSTILGDLVTVHPGQTPRYSFAAWLTAPDNPRFAPVLANRLWSRAFGIGLVEPVDDFTDDTSPSNPALLDYLTEQTRRLRFDTRELSRAIYYSQAYQRQSTAGEVDRATPYYFPGPVLRRMSAEQLWDSLMTLIVPGLDGREGIARLGGYAALDEIDISTMTPEQVVAKARELAAEAGPEARARRRARQEMANGTASDRSPDGIPPQFVRASESPTPARPGTFVAEFGASDREIIDSAHTDPTVTQALEMLNGRTTNGLLGGKSLVSQDVTLAKNPTEQARVLFLSILGREPSDEDLAAALEEIEHGGNNGLRNVAAALLNTREFIFIQ